MAQSKRKAVFNAGPGQLERIEALVRARKYGSPSEFLREAIDEKLAALERARMDEQVAAFCAASGDDDDDLALIAAQPLAGES